MNMLQSHAEVIDERLVQRETLPRASREAIVDSSIVLRVNGCAMHMVATDSTIRTYDAMTWYAQSFVPRTPTDAVRVSCARDETEPITACIMQVELRVGGRVVFDHGVQITWNHEFGPPHGLHSGCNNHVFFCKPHLFTFFAHLDARTHVATFRRMTWTRHDDRALWTQDLSQLPRSNVSYTPPR